jgi:hypothetical protein
MVFWISFDIHRVVVVNLSFGEIWNTVFTFFVNPVAAGAIDFVQNLSFFKPVDGIFTGLLGVMGRDIIFRFFLTRTMNDTQANKKNDK